MRLRELRVACSQFATGISGCGVRPRGRKEFRTIWGISEVGGSVNRDTKTAVLIQVAMIINHRPALITRVKHIEMLVIGG